MIRFPSSVKYFAISAHPAFAMYGFPQMAPHIREAISRGKRFAMGMETRPKIDIRIVHTEAEARAYVAARKPGEPIFIDIETPYDAHEQIDIVGLSVSPYTAIVFYMTPAFGDLLAEILADSKIVKGGHNFSFDVNAFRANGYEVAWPVVDTIQAEALLYPPFKEAAKHKWLALAACVLRRFPGPFWKDWQSPFAHIYFASEFPHVAKCDYRALYCGLDTMWNWMLWRAQRVELEQSGMFKLYRDILAPAGYAFAQMEDEGVPVDEERRRAKREVCEERIRILNADTANFTAEMHARRIDRLKAAQEQLEAAVVKTGDITTEVFCAQHPEYKGLTRRQSCPGCAKVFITAADLRLKVKDLKLRISKAKAKLKQIGTEFAPTNPNHWRYVLFTEPPYGLGLMPIATTGKDALPAINKDTLIELEKLYPDVPLMAWRRELAHREHQMKFIYDIPLRNGRAHFLFPLHKAENGRSASGSDFSEEGKGRESEGGNGQNITESDRQIFCAPPGFTWVEADGSQFELRVMAWLAEAKALLQALKDGIDIHAENAAAIFGCKPEDATKMKVWFEGQLQEARRASKRPTHGWDYGLGDVKCGKMFKPMAKEPLNVIREFLNKWAVRTAGKDGVTLASWDRRLRAVERAANPEVEMRKFILRRYEEANTLRAREWRLAYFARWPELARYQDRVIAEVTSGNHTLTNPFGRVRKFWGFRWDYDTKQMVFTEREEALAQNPSSTVGDMAKWYMRPLKEIVVKRGGFLVHMGHDSFSACIPDVNVAAYIAEARVLLEREWPEMGKIEGFGMFRCPFEFKVGQNWGPKHAHIPSCAKDCEKENPDGLVKYKEAA